MPFFRRIADKLLSMVGVKSEGQPDEDPPTLTYLKPEDSRGSFFKRADLLLYRAKNKGRKQICSE